MNWLKYTNAYGIRQADSLSPDFTKGGILILISRLINAGAKDIEVTA
jgi:hypothetical protein